MSNAQKTQIITNWEAGDRVYLVAAPELTGTVQYAEADTLLVAWDFGGNGFYADADLECYTLPPAEVL